MNSNKEKRGRQTGVMPALEGIRGCKRETMHHTKPTRPVMGKLSVGGTIVNRPARMKIQLGLPSLVSGHAATGSGKLRRRYVVPPFSVLNAREGSWQARKRMWTKIGIVAAAGRFGYTLNGPSDPPQDVRPEGDGSIFDPVLCEIMLKWFCIPGGKVLDPFAGEATKGIVAGCLGYDYTGIEVREEQVEVNRLQAQNVKQLLKTPAWIVGNSFDLKSLIPSGSKFDMVFTSPPYYDLEVYSKKDNDMSAFRSYETFIEWYRHIFHQAVEYLDDNRFLVTKVGEVRSRVTHEYYNFVSDTITCFLDAGLKYYNEIILVTAIGSLPVRFNSIFPKNRKIGKTHQNVLVFYKGDCREIQHKFPRYSDAGDTI